MPKCDIDCVMIGIRLLYDKNYSSMRSRAREFAHLTGMKESTAQTVLRRIANRKLKDDIAKHLAQRTDQV